MKFQIKESQIIIMMGVIGLMVILISKFPVLIKAITSIICVGIILFGMFIETPLLGHLNPPPEGIERFDNN